MQNRRKIVIVDAQFQYRFIAYLLALALGAFMLINISIVGVIYFIPVAYLFDSWELYLGLTLVAIELLCLAAIFFLARRASHQLSGPVYNLSQSIKAIEQGDFSRRVVLRKGDAFTDMAAQLNQTMDTLSADVQLMQTEMTSLISKLESGSAERQHAKHIVVLLEKYRIADTASDNKQETPN